jgi:hypothetical protein
MPEAAPVTSATLPEKRTRSCNGIAARSSTSRVNVLTALKGCRERADIFHRVTDPTSIAVAFRPGMPSRREQMTALRGLDWTPRSYELIAVAFGIVVTLALRSTPLPLSDDLALYLLQKGALCVGGVYAVALVIVAGRLAIDVRRHGAQGIDAPERLGPLLEPYASLDFLVLTVRRALAIFTAIYFFLHLKHVILWLNFANWDRTLWDFDRWLHGGVQPSVWLMEHLGRHHDVALLIDWLYVEYFDYKIIVSLLLLAEIGGRKLSAQFVLAYTLLWTLGGLAYLIMPADGPCFAMLLGASDLPTAAHQWGFQYPIATDVPASYAETFRHAKIWLAKNYQHALWATRWRFVYQGKLPDMFYGVAAMPSLHVGAVSMLAYYLWRLSPWAGLVGIAYAAIIAVGSVFLQWHYAIDGYAGMLLAAITVVLANRLPVKVPLRRLAAN